MLHLHCAVGTQPFVFLKFSKCSFAVVFLRSSSKFMFVQPLILSIQSFLFRPRAFDPGIFPINICDSNLFPLKLCPKYLHLTLPTLLIGLSHLFIVVIILTFDFFLFPANF